MSTIPFSNNLKGILLVGCAALAWGSMAVAAQYLLQYHSVAPGELSSLRLFASGLILTCICCAVKVKNIFVPLQNKKLGLQVALSGVLLCFGHLTFFVAIYYSNAGTGAIFLATQPLMAALYLCLTKHEFPSTKILFCIVLAFVGVFLIVTDGQVSTLKFSFACVVWGLVSTTFATAYSIQPKNVITALGTLPVASWGLLAGGIAGCLISPPIHLISNFDIPASLAMAFIVLIGTIFAFWCYVSGMKYISPVLIGLLLTLEPLSAFAFSIVSLNESVGLFQAIGIFCIMWMVLILTLGNLKLLTLIKDRLLKSASGINDK